MADDRKTGGTVLILGASGRFGRNAADAFWSAGWTVRLFDRAKDNLMQAAQGTDVIVNAWNPRYDHWAAQVPGLHAQAIAAAKAASATVIVPGNVYVFGEQTPAPWSERTPHAAQNPMGRIRTGMEDAYRRSGVRTIILRAGDFLDIEASGNWFDRVMAPKLAKGKFTYPGDMDVMRAWAFLPDLARAAVILAEKRSELPVFVDVPFEGYSITGADMVAAVRRVVPRKVRVARFPWFALQVAGLVNPMMRCMVEMSYLWRTPHRLDGTLFRQLAPDFRETPLDEAVARAVAFTGVMDRGVREATPVARASA
ncbi:Rossmann-fold NAD(P)-binding domain-containing protein [Chachezhania sediminis]|uniref:sugar nucleotide-binding protein n=1 Tax=Chachezhania sediminis TaxID=2599291 RepID=UPI00131E867A|nr:sugar nucleotide-binding protein [Chachezhania sediminis]